MKKELLDKLENTIEEEITDKISEHLRCIGYNLKQVFGGLLYQIKLDLEKDGIVGEIDKLIDMIISTSHYSGPENEEYPSFDEKISEDILQRVSKKLETYGIYNHFYYSQLGKRKKVIK